MYHFVLVFLSLANQNLVDVNFLFINNTATNVSVSLLVCTLINRNPGQFFAKNEVVFYVLVIRELFQY